jgi:hypothetical protein
LCLVNVGYINSDKSVLQKGANYLAKFVELAPETHKFKSDAKATIEELKKTQNVTPQKTPKSGGSPKKKP